MTAAQDLMNNPTGFMQENIVIVSHSGTNTGADYSVVGGVQQLTLYSLPAHVERAHKRNFQNTPVGLYHLGVAAAVQHLVQAIVDPHTIPAYFCPYDQNHTLGTIISSQARLMFTTQMDGCTFGVGSRAPNGMRLVFHTNQAVAGNPANPDAQATAQQQELQQAFARYQTPIGGTLAPQDYRTSSKGTVYKATTFGVRNTATNTWTFYTQRYTIETAGVIPVVYGLKEMKRIDVL